MGNTDRDYLQQALRLAKKGLGKTLPNPMVGAVIVKDGNVIGKGYHHKAGLAHAEIEALHTVNSSAKGATLYVNLEPCAHQGKTPPCVEAIIAAGIARVVCCNLDPNPLVSGQGVDILRKAGIEVSVGGLAEEAAQLNQAFFSFQTKKRPFIALKFASSLDGKIATKTGDSKWITSEKARHAARQLRGQYQAILIGANTAIQDDPHLGTHNPRLPDPLRIILDSRLRIPLESQVLRDSNVLVITTTRASKERRDAFAKKNVPVFVCSDYPLSLGEAMAELARREIVSIFVEGGGTVLGSFVDARLVDKVYAFHGPLVIGGANAITAVSGQGAPTIDVALRLTKLSYRKLDSTMLTTGYPAL